MANLCKRLTICVISIGSQEEIRDQTGNWWDLKSHLPPTYELDRQPQGIDEQGQECLLTTATGHMDVVEHTCQGQGENFIVLQ